MNTKNLSKLFNFDTNKRKKTHKNIIDDLMPKKKIPKLGNSTT